MTKLLAIPTIRKSGDTNPYMARKFWISRDSNGDYIGSFETKEGADAFGESELHYCSKKDFEKFFK